MAREKDPRYMSTFIRLLGESRFPYLRRGAVKAISNLPAPINEAIEPLFDRVENDPSPMVQLEAAKTLVKFGHTGKKDRALVRKLIEILSGEGQETWDVKLPDPARRWFKVPEEVYVDEKREMWRCEALAQLVSIKDQLTETEMANIDQNTSALLSARNTQARNRAEDLIRSLHKN